MKIKSVKITGFRAFEKEEDSTFDFTKDGEVMNFASIYAPNGFGKTSFYDAIEWGVTHKIQRFDRMVDFDKVRKDNVAPLLLNKASKTGKVIVETTKENFENVINTRRKYDTKAKANNEYFKDQILTQDLIDAFLKEEKADKRYENFLEIDNNLKKYDAIYKKINRLLEYIKDQRKEYTKKKDEEEEKIQVEINFEEEYKKFDEINAAIVSLNIQNENLSLVNKQTFNQTNHENLSRNVDVRLLSLEEELIKAKSRIDSIILARDGKETEDNKLEGGILSYLHNRSKALKLNEQLIELNQIIKWFDNQEKIKNDLNLNTDNLKSEQNKLERTLNIEKQFETFINIQKEIDVLYKDISESNEKLRTTEREKQVSENEKNDASIKLNELKKSLENKHAILNSIPNKKEDLEVTTSTISNTKKNIDDLSKSLVTQEIKLNKLNEILEQFKYYENQINVDIETLLEFNLFNEQQDLVTIYAITVKKVDDLKNSLNEIQSKIDNQNNLNNEVKNFINTGLELANKSQSSDCPLCNHDYKSFEQLSENILSNKLFDLQLKLYLEEKIAIETELNNLSLRLYQEKEAIIKSFDLLREPYQLEYKTAQNTVNRLVSERMPMLDNMNKNQLKLQDLQLFFGDQIPDKLTSKLLEDISTIEAELSKIIELSNNIDRKILNDDTIIKSYENNLIISKTNLAKLQSSNEYEEVRKFFIEELSSNTFEKTILEQHQSFLKLTINNLITVKDSLTTNLDKLKIKLANYTSSQSEYITKINELESTKNLILRAYENYEHYIQSEFKVLISDKDKSQIEYEFLNLIEKQKNIQKLIESKTEKLKIIRILNDACIEATESKKVQDNIEEIKKYIKEIDKAEEKLTDEKRNLKSYLKKTIEAYFYTPLINAIYSKIDPHPDYKSIEFECDFAENKPRLQIYTISDKLVRSVPSLYFSTAQINILSLSIFLARALKTRDNKQESVDCIFIDDPIQSMDSINILSFIDLFRGLTMSLDKQLIVSTHEENFHLLLKKKIPSDLFKSKFLEFETFGKVIEN